jgi:hypothetical protein
LFKLFSAKESSFLQFRIFSKFVQSFFPLSSYDTDKDKKNLLMIAEENNRTGAYNFLKSYQNP